MINVQSVLEELTGLLDIFFQGLAECQLVSGYNVSLETSDEMLKPTKRCLPLILAYLRPLHDSVKKLILRYEELEQNLWSIEEQKAIEHCPLATEIVEVSNSNAESIERQETGESSTHTLLCDVQPDIIEETEVDNEELSIHAKSSNSSEKYLQNGAHSSNTEAQDYVTVDTQPTNGEIESASKDMELRSNEERANSDVDTCTIVSSNLEAKSKTPSLNSNSMQFALTKIEAIPVESTCMDFHLQQPNDSLTDSKDEEEKLEFPLEENLPQVDDRLTHVDTIPDLWESKDLLTLHSSNKCWVPVDTAPDSDVSFPSAEGPNSSKTAHRCPDCFRTYKSANHLETHRKRAHCAPQMCDMCGQVVSSILALQEHCREVHNGIGCFQCNFCKKRFMFHLSYKRHLDTHKPSPCLAVCEICGKSFKRADYMQRHILSHNGRRPHPCNFCGKSFISKNHLKNHQEAIHSNQKSHRCHLCEKAFARRDKLGEHILRHLNVKKYSCKICGKEYAENRDLKKHQTRCLESEPHKQPNEETSS